MENTQPPTPSGLAAAADVAAADGAAGNAAALTAGCPKDGAAGNAAVGAGSGGGRVRVRPQVVVFEGVRGIFAPDAAGVWRLANSTELAVLEGLGGPKSGIGLLRGLDAALEAELAGPGDLGRLAGGLDLLLGMYRANSGGSAGWLAADGLLGALTVACSAVDEDAAAQWLCWALGAPTQPNLTGALWVGAGWECWEASTRNWWAGDRWGPEFLDGLGEGFWERVRSHPNPMVRDAAAAVDPAAGRTAVRRALRRAASPAQAPEVLDVAISHPRIAGRALWRLLRVERYQHTWRAAQNKSAPRWVLHLIARGRTHAGYGWAHTRSCIAVAQNPRAWRRTVDLVALSDDWAVRTWAAHSPRAGRRTLRRLAGDDHWWVRRCVAANPATPRRLVEHLAFDGRREVRADAAANPKLPGRLAEWLAGDQAQAVRAAAARREYMPARLVERLAGDESQQVRAAVAYREGLPARLAEMLAEDPHLRVRKAVAWNPDSPHSVLARLAADESRQVRALVAGNPECPPEAITRLAADSPQVRQAAAGNHHSPPQVLEQLASDRHSGVRRWAAANPNSPPHMLEKLAGDRNRFVRAAAAANPNSPQSALERLSGDSRYLVFSAARAEIARRRRTREADPTDPQEPQAGQQQPASRADSAADCENDGVNNDGGNEAEHRDEGEGRCPI